VNRISIAVVLFISFALFTVSNAEDISPDQFRRMVGDEIKANGSSGDSIGTVMRVSGYGEKNRDFLIVPVVRNGSLVSVYRDDPKRSSITEICSKTNVKALKLTLFSIEGAKRELDKQGVVDPVPKLISVGPISFLGALSAGWYHDTGESFVFLSLTGRLVTESDIARYWPEHLEDLRAVGR